MINIKHDFELDIATAHSRMSRKWKNRAWRWSELLERCAQTKRTSETLGEYARMSARSRAR